MKDGEVWNWRIEKLGLCWNLLNCFKESKLLFYQWLIDLWAIKTPYSSSSWESLIFRRNSLPRRCLKITNTLLHLRYLIRTDYIRILILSKFCIITLNDEKWFEVKTDSSNKGFQNRFSWPKLFKNMTFDQYLNIHESHPWNPS